MTVSVAPATDSLYLGETQQFAATVSHATSNAVNWSVNDVAGGNSFVGAIVPASPGADIATYTAPQLLPSAATITITAMSRADPSASGSASVQIQSNMGVSTSPTSASIGTNATQPFAATVSGTGSPNIAVTWSVDGVAGGNSTDGTIASTAADAATYTAPVVVPSPPTVSVVATSVADSSKSATATVTITCAPSSSLTPATATVSTGAKRNFTASLCVPTSTAIVWEVNGVTGGNSTLGTTTPSGTSPSTATYDAPAAIPATNPVTIHATAGAQSAAATVTIVNSAPIVVTVSPKTASVPVGQRASFAATVTGTSNLGITWTVNGVANGNSSFSQVCAPSSNPCAPPSGNKSDVDYLAPAAEPTPDTVTLTAASVSNPASTGSAQITITPPPPVTVNIAPLYIFLNASRQFQFVASVSGNTNQSVAWRVSTAVPG